MLAQSGGRDVGSVNVEGEHDVLLVVNQQLDKGHRGITTIRGVGGDGSGVVHPQELCSVLREPVHRHVGNADDAGTVNLQVKALVVAEGVGEAAVGHVTLRDGEGNPVGIGGEGHLLVFGEHADGVELLTGLLGSMGHIAEFNVSVDVTQGDMGHETQDNDGQENPADDFDDTVRSLQGKVPFYSSGFCRARKWMGGLYIYGLLTDY